MFTFLLKTSDLVDKALDINPYGTAAIGVLIVGMFFLLKTMYKEINKRDELIKEERNYNKELSEKVISLMEKVGQGFDSDREFKIRLESNITEVRNDFKLLDQLVRSHDFSNTTLKQQGND